MKAIVNMVYGSPDVLEYVSVEKPAPTDDELLIKIHAAGVNAADWRLLRADPFLARIEMGLFKPKNKILGADVAGVVESVGKNVTKFKVGDTVFGDLSGYNWGSFAEYVCATENVIAHKPKNLSFEQAAAVPLAAITALQAIRDKGQVQANHKVLINGASGGVGTFMLQIAKAFGAEVTAVCSTEKVELVRSLGADHIIDYKEEDFSQNGKIYDLLVAVNGSRPIREYQRMLTPSGRYICVGGTLMQLFASIFLGPLLSIGSKQKLGNVLAKPNHTDLVYLKEMIEKGQLKPIMDRQFDLHDVPDAIRYIEKGHAKGKVVIRIV